ncbi:MAG: thioredoxin family protein [Bacteroidales bacterium]|nr:thioredoxin family protein [Bacteroidales bacterium]MCF8338935.1 thioredoxin family protein [Bacteroidales bacterium]
MSNDKYLFLYLIIKIIGTVYPNCKKLEQMCNEVVKEKNLDAQVNKVTDVNEVTCI